MCHHRRVGICFTAEEDQKLTRGWPYLIVPVDGLKADKTMAPAEKAYLASDPVYFTEWPRRTLHRYMHGSMATRSGASTEWRVALANDAAPTPDEAIEALRGMFRVGWGKNRFHERDFVWGVEAIAGTDATLEAIAEEVEAFEFRIGDTWIRNPWCRASVLEAAAFLLLRATEAVATSARERLERMFSAPRDPNAAQTYSAFYGALDYVLHGAAGVKREKAKYPTMKLEVWALGTSATLDFAGDDPAYVQAMVASTDKKAPMSARIPAIGGTSVLHGLEARKWPAVQWPSIVRDFGMIERPRS